MEFMAAVAPVAQRITRRRLDLDDIGAEIAKLQRHHVSGNQPGQIEDRHTIERPAGLRVETDRRGVGCACHRRDQNVMNRRLAGNVAGIGRMNLMRRE
jgi:hypothetical protein